MTSAFRDQIKCFVVKHLLAYDAPHLVAILRALGIRQGDTLMVHSSWQPLNGFRGKPADLIAALKEVVGSEGLLVMPSLSYHNESSAEFLARGVPMNVRRSPSRMGLLTEVFRRNREVVRSLSPTHPLLAWGRDTEAFLAGHDQAIEPFGSASPFGRLLERDGWILGFDAPFSTITFTHFVEDHLAARLPFPFYDPELRMGTVIDYAGEARQCPVRVISAQANSLRREERYVAELKRQGGLRHRRIGNTRLLLLRCRDMVECADAMAVRGELFFDVP
ncbi:AAC(3) family N-acetyltransferase [Candidatus Contendibacter odensensis]|uniref:Aminoglycoside N(3)-acetyltransferase n=1 Tax=Candidatus Contendobacter odensis Run_B_J11 TaxID=1400861 RepID=A0A7U7J1Q9_9GAMM|nr:AAC(3) family N-acetyltransferase [Candidatus Contendobacter odensis]CDH43056.1 Aminoglycoside 3-N-acetyltransferase [Candidatus Contendobacter odensis Run_B_J11]